MKKLLICSLGILLTGCDQGDFCDRYTPLDLTDGGARALVVADLNAAKRAAVNEAAYGSCPSRQ